MGFMNIVCLLSLVASASAQYTSPYETETDDPTSAPYPTYPTPSPRQSTTQSSYPSLSEYPAPRPRRTESTTPSSYPSRTAEAISPSGQSEATTLPAYPRQPQYPLPTSSQEESPTPSSYYSRPGITSSPSQLESTTQSSYRSRPEYPTPSSSQSESTTSSSYPGRSEYSLGQPDSTTTSSYPSRSQYPDPSPSQPDYTPQPYYPNRPEYQTAAPSQSEPTAPSSYPAQPEYSAPSSNNEERPYSSTPNSGTYSNVNSRCKRYQDGTTIPGIAGCFQYYECMRGEARYKECDIDYRYDEEEGECVYDRSCVTACPPGYEPNTYDDTKFKVNGTEVSCPGKSTYFDFRICSCQFRRNSQAKGYRR